MKKVRNTLVAIALVVTLSGPVVLGMGSGALANLASSRHVSSSFATGKSMGPIAFKRLGICPVAGGDDC
jgi:hypothetical protein